MNTSDPTRRQTRSDSLVAVSIMFFFVALLCFALGLADGVRHQRMILHIPQSAGWLIATGILVVIGVICLLRARSSRRS